MFDISGVYRIRRESVEHAYMVMDSWEGLRINTSTEPTLIFQYALMGNRKIKMKIVNKRRRRE
jgi:hypothetical protein